MFAHVKHARINFISATRDLTIKLVEQIQLKWSANLHLKVLTLYNEIKEFIQEIKPASNKNRSIEATEPKQSIHWAVKVDGDFQFLISMSKKHEAVIVASELAFGRTQTYAGVETKLLKIAIDDADIFTFTRFEVSRQNDDQDVADERRRAEDLTLPVNRVW